MCAIIHQQTAIDLGLLQDWKPYCQYDPVPVLENEHYLLYWDRTIQIDHLVLHNRPGIVLRDKRARHVKDLRHRRSPSQKHPAELYNQDSKVLSANARNHRIVESEIDHCPSHCDFGYGERAGKLCKWTEGSWRALGTCGSPEKSIIEYLQHTPFLLSRPAMY